jgi:hypothetical protein
MKNVAEMGPLVIIYILSSIKPGPSIRNMKVGRYKGTKLAMRWHMPSSIFQYKESGQKTKRTIGKIQKKILRRITYFPLIHAHFYRIASVV